MPDFYIIMNKLGTIESAKKIQPTENYPEPWGPNNKTAIVVDGYRSYLTRIQMLIQAPNMCSAIKTIDSRRKREIISGLL